VNLPAQTQGERGTAFNAPRASFTGAVLDEDGDAVE
jgi:hypothetical protein